MPVIFLSTYKLPTFTYFIVDKCATEALFSKYSNAVIFYLLFKITINKILFLRN